MLRVRMFHFLILSHPCEAMIYPLAEYFSNYHNCINCALPISTLFELEFQKKLNMMPVLLFSLLRQFFFQICNTAKMLR